MSGCCALSACPTTTALLPPPPSPGSAQAAADLAAHQAGRAQRGDRVTREQWLALTGPQLVADGDGFKSHYDPAIAAPFRLVTPELARAGEAALWAGYDRVACPTLLIRGAQSDLLSAATAQAMTQRGPRARLVELPGIGHAPTLVQPDQVALVQEFLLGALTA